MIAGFIPPTAICQHPAGYHHNDPPSYSYDANKPDKARFEIEDAQPVGAHIVLKVKYPNCASCAYEGNKVMVFLNTTALQVMKWREIDPHFRAEDGRAAAVNIGRAAPSPAARFPASKEGWQDAIEYATRKR